MIEVSSFGDRALEIRLPSEDHVRARRVLQRIEAAQIGGVVECVAGWDVVLAHVDEGAPIEAIADELRVLLASDDPHDVEIATPTTHVVRARYDGPDLRELADAFAMSPRALAEAHAATTYEVEVIGFLPGFAYLGRVDSKIERPRRATPRTRVEPGSIGIAGARTAIYPVASPGGWNLIARTVDFVPFDAARTPPCRFALGDRVRFDIVEVAGG